MSDYIPDTDEESEFYQEQGHNKQIYNNVSTLYFSIAICISKKQLK